MTSRLWDRYHLFHLAANVAVLVSRCEIPVRLIFCPAVLDEISQFSMPILSRFLWNLWCLAAFVPPTTQSIFDKIIPTYSLASTKSTSTSLSFSSTTSTAINPIITRFSSSRVTPVVPQTYTVDVGKVSIPFTLLLRYYPMTQLNLVSKRNFQYVPDTIQANVGDIVGKRAMKALESSTYLTLHGYDRIRILPSKPLSSSSRISTSLRPIRTVRRGKSRLFLWV